MACACGLPGSVTICCCSANPLHSNQVAASRVVIDFDVCLGLESIYDRPLGWAIEAGSAKVATRGAIASKMVLRMSSYQIPCS